MADVLTIAWYGLLPNLSFGLYVECVFWVVCLMRHLGCMSDVPCRLYVSYVV